MTEERLHAFQVTLYETNEKELQKLALQLGNPKYKEGLRKYFLEKKLYRILSLMIDEESFKLLEEANKNISKIVNSLMVNGGWSASRYGISNFPNEERAFEDFPEEFADGKRMYHLVRDENGYRTEDYVPEEESFAYYARQTEEEFLKEREVELKILHQMYSIKERIMGGDYKINPKHADLAEFICEYFGYGKKEELEKTK